MQEYISDHDLKTCLTYDNTYGYMYELKVKNGVYKADSLFALVKAVLIHRFRHLINDGKWMD